MGRPQLLGVARLTLEQLEAHLLHAVVEVTGRDPAEVQDGANAIRLSGAERILGTAFQQAHPTSRAPWTEKVGETFARG
jgi:hypothetical protein